MSANHILVDFENVPSLPSVLPPDVDLKLHLFVGPTQKSVSTDAMEFLLKEASRVTLTRLHATGKNAVDFALSCYLGKLIEREPKGYFHVIAKDKGYDPLIAHLRAAKVHVSRYDTPDQTPILRPALIKDVERRSEDLKLRLAPGAKNRPTKKKSLFSSIKAHFANQLSAEEIEAIILSLEKAGVIAIDAVGKVSYPN